MLKCSAKYSIIAAVVVACAGAVIMLLWRMLTAPAYWPGDLADAAAQGQLPSLTLSSLNPSSIYYGYTIGKPGDDLCFDSVDAAVAASNELDRSNELVQRAVQ